MSTPIGLAVLVACLLLPLAGLAQDNPPAAVHASLDDCAVIAEVGNAQLQWGKTPPSSPMSAKSYGTDCDWKLLGMADPGIAAANAPLSFSLSRPVYSSDGLRATLEYDFGGSSSATSSFYAGYSCTVQKLAGQWQLDGCNMRYIT